jgi:hypothetical protein
MKSIMTYEEMVNYLITVRESNTPPTDEQLEDLRGIFAKVRADINNINSFTLQQLQMAMRQLLWRLNDWDANAPLPIDTRGSKKGADLHGTK